MYGKKHPEAKIGEIFLTNSNFLGFEKISFPSKRMGEIAYSGDGRIIEKQNWFPIFISISDLLDTDMDIKDLRKEIRDMIEATFIN